MLEARTRLDHTPLDYFALSRLPSMSLGDADHLPVTVTILLEMSLRDEHASADVVTSLAGWTGGWSCTATDARRGGARSGRRQNDLLCSFGLIVQLKSRTFTMEVYSR